MSKRRAVSIIIVVLMVGSTSWGGILQGQGFAIGTDNMIHLAQGDQSGQSSQDLLIDISQNTEGTGLAMVSASAYGVTQQGGANLGALGLIGVGRVNAVSVGGGLGVVAAPIVPLAGMAGLQLAKARLNGLLLGAN